jgi:hypothetical protein
MTEVNEDIQQLKGFIYRLNCSDGYFYIGSTISSIRKRLTEHKQCAKKHPNRKLYKHILNIGWENVGLQCLEEILYSFRDELYEKEDDYIKKERLNPFCLNINAALNTTEETKERQKEYREENREIINEKIAAYRKTNDKHREYNREYSKKHSKENYEKNKEHISEMCKKYYENHKEEILKRGKEWKEENKEYLQEYSKEYYHEHKNKEDYKEKVKERSKRYYEENYDVIREKNKEYYEKNREAIAIQQKEKNRYKNSEQIQCECGGKYVEYHKKRHFESKKHLEHVQKKETKNPPFTNVNPKT